MIVFAERRKDMELLELMKSRRSIRKFTDQEIPAQKMERILEAGVLAPTSKGRNPWKFHLITDKAMLARLSRAKWHGARPLETASAAVVVVADSEISDVWIEDCSISLAYMHLMATDQGVGSCWVQMRLRKDCDGCDAEQNVLSALGHDAPWRMVGILALGMPGEEKAPYSDEDVDDLMKNKVL
jgi:nitroreductase